MPLLKNQEEIDAYYIADPTHHRAAAVMWVTLVERRIDALFKIALRQDKAVLNELFQPTGALGNYAVKLRLAYMLGWFGKDIYNDLKIIGKIRNRFAHDIKVTNFSDKKIASWLESMKVYKLITHLRNHTEDRLRDDTSSICQIVDFILEDIMEDEQYAFRACIDIMISYLDKCRNNMEINLSKFSEDWMTYENALSSSENF